MPKRAVDKKPIEKESVQKQAVAWQPTPKQTEALLRTDFEVLYGGARGGGKTDAGIAWMLYGIEQPLYRGLVIRRNADDLKDWIDRATRLYSLVGAVKSGTPAEFRFPSGAIIRTGHLNDDEAYTKYQGHEYQRILIEELTQINKEQNYLMLIASCRSSVKGLTPQVFATTNPGGAGHKWVKDRFIDVATPGIPYIDPVSGRSRVFISAKVTDNPHLMTSDPMYIKMLDALPQGLREAWRDGSWDDVEVDGAYYAQQLQLLQRENRRTLVPVEISMPVYTFWDIGIGDSTAIWFIQLVGNEVRWIDYYEANDEGLPHYINVLKSKPYQYAEHYAPHDIEVREFTSGMSRFEIAKNMGIHFKIVDRLSLQDGIDALRLVLNYSLFDYKNTEVGFNALKQYRKEWNEKMNTWKDKPLHDWTSHAADAARYAAVSINKLKESAKVHTQSTGLYHSPIYSSYVAEHGTAFELYE